MSEAEGAAKRCRDCRTLFTIQAEHVKWFANKGLFLPARCPTCREKRKKKKKASEQQSSKPLESFDPTPTMTSVTFDPDLLNLLQDAAESFDSVHKNLISRPIEDLTTFKDLDRLFAAGAELLGSLKLNGFLMVEDEDEQAEEEVETHLSDKRPLVERLRDVGLKVESISPHQRTDDEAQAEPEVIEEPSPSTETAQAAQ